MRPDVIIFADCGPDIGLGHLRRSCAIGRALTKHGLSVRLVTPVAEAARLASQAGLEGVVRKGPESLPEATITMFDTYRCPIGIMTRRRSRGFVAVIDDLGDRALDADLIINPNPYGSQIDYEKYRPIRVVAGLLWCPIDPAFVGARRPLAERMGRVLITFGGTDDGGMAIATAEALVAKIDCQTDIVVAPLQPLSKKLKRRVETLPKSHLHYAPNMPALMAGACLYVGAAGSTVWEACAAGLDVVAAALYDNQKLILSALVNEGFETVTTFDAEALSAAAARRLASPVENPLTTQLDGRGAERVAESMIDMACAEASV